MIDLQAQFDSLPTSGLLIIPPGRYDLLRPLDWTGKPFHVRGPGAYLVPTYPVLQDYPVVTIGGKPGQLIEGITWEGPRIELRPPGWNVKNPLGTGLRIQNSICGRFSDLWSVGFLIGIDVVANGTYCAYNRLDVCKVNESRTWLRALACQKAPSEWINEITVNGGDFCTSANPQLDRITGLLMKNCGNWRFYGSCFQMTQGLPPQPNLPPEWAELWGCEDIMFRDCRFEGAGMNSPTPVVFADPPCKGILISGGCQGGIDWQVYGTNCKREWRGITERGLTERV